MVIKNRLAILFTIAALILPILFGLTSLVDGNPSLIAMWLMIGGLVSSIPSGLAIFCAQGTERKAISILSKIPMFTVVPASIIGSIVIMVNI